MALKYSDTDSSGSRSLSSDCDENGSGSIGELDRSGDDATSVDGGVVTLVDGAGLTLVDGGGGVSSLEVTLVVIAFILSTSSVPL